MNRKSIGIEDIELIKKQAAEASGIPNFRTLTAISLSSTLKRRGKLRQAILFLQKYILLYGQSPALLRQLKNLQDSPSSS